MTVQDDMVVLIKSNAFGEGEPDLGEKLLVNFIRMIAESGRLPGQIICMNSGIFLTTEGTPVLDILKLMAESGTKILSCGTCLDYYNRADKLIIGEATNMRDTVSTLLSDKKVITI